MGGYIPPISGNHHIYHALRCSFRGLWKICQEKIHVYRGCLEWPVGSPPIHIAVNHETQERWLVLSSLGIISIFFASFTPAVGSLLWPLFCLKSWNPDKLSLWNTKICRNIEWYWIMTSYIAIAKFCNFWAKVLPRSLHPLALLSGSIFAWNHAIARQIFFSII